ncbi:zf-TFIIB domain-containing protein [Microcoleus sp. AR_TQ3_B6]|uniref:zf-TFIIB domain-containing protein n=1 Tax=Microcoleus sp. AR_TQ3_B6 TaxID=3055284 RepID=UPI002FD36CC4
MECPKCKHPNLEGGTLAGSMSVEWCPNCYGIWIPGREYEAWQKEQRQWYNKSDKPQATGTLGIEFTPSAYDSKAALCPEDGHYLSRAKVPFSRVPFYIERCMLCGGIWCDNGEWDILETLGFHTEIDKMFSPNWQAKARVQELASRERQVLTEKLGPDIAGYVLELAEVLADHPHADCAATYILRRAELKRKEI